MDLVEMEMGERRKQKRMKGKIAGVGEFSNGACSFTAVGEIIDINTEGCSFFYMTSAQLIECSSMTIFPYEAPTPEPVKLPCALIYETTLGSFASGPLVPRRCGIRFGELTEEQKLQLTTILQTYAA
jgi:hypothetical protein